MTRGGKQPGAGRPKGAKPPKGRASFRADAEVLAWLRRAPQSGWGSAGAYLETLARREMLASPDAPPAP